MLEEEVANYLAGAGIGMALASTSGACVVFGAPFPAEAPMFAACVIDYGAEEYVEGFGASLSAPLLEVARFQVVVRDVRDNYVSARQLAWDAHRKLRRFSGTMSVPGSTSTIQYSWIKALGKPFFLKFDENDNAVFASNYRTHKAEST